MDNKRLQPSDLDSFHAHGYVALRGFHPATQLSPIKERVLDELARLKVWSNGKSGRSALAQMPPFQQIAKLSTMVKLPDLHEALSTPGIRAAVALLAGSNPLTATGTQPLLSLPHQGRWSLNKLNWHVDVSSNPDAKIPGIQVFHLIDDVAPHGGATLALANVHRLDADATRALRASLKATADLDAVLRESGTQVVEISGRAGDVFLMDMRLLHTPSVNTTRTIRMMATERFMPRQSAW